MDDARYPVKPGDWVQDRDEPSKVAIVKDVRIENSTGEFLVDLYFHDREGKRIGRLSEPLGGPRTYEPSCPWDRWRRIGKPDFPIELRWVDAGDGRRTASYVCDAKILPDREWVRPADPRPSASAVSRRSDHDPRMEAHARRIAAQELRDLAKAADPEMLVRRADELEAEAERLSPRF